MENTRIYEYTSAANPVLSNVPIEYHHSDKYENSPTSIIPFDNKEFLKTEYLATSPSLLASFVKIQKNQHIFTDANTTSHFFYVSKGSGLSIINNEEIYWVKGDIFVVPHINTSIKHISSEDTLLLWVTDEPLLSYLGVRPTIPKFEFALFKHELMMNESAKVRFDVYDYDFENYIIESLVKQGIDKNEVYTLIKSIHDDIIPLLVKVKFHHQRVRPYQLAYYFNLDLYRSIIFFIFVICQLISCFTISSENISFLTNFVL